MLKRRISARAFTWIAGAVLAVMLLAPGASACVSSPAAGVPALASYDCAWMPSMDCPDSSWRKELALDAEICAPGSQEGEKAPGPLRSGTWYGAALLLPYRMDLNRAAKIMPERALDLPAYGGARLSILFCSLQT